jgi:glycosyltransferase involved in cell wall biosynthesis
MMRIDFLLGDLGLGGAQTVVVGLAAELAKAGADVRILSMSSGGLLLPEAQESARVVELASRSVAAVPALRTALKSDPPDVLVSSQANGLTLGWLARSSGWVRRHAAMLHGFRGQELSQAGGIWRGTVVRASRKAAARADVACAVSLAVAAEFAMEAPKAASRIRVLPNGPVAAGDIVRRRAARLSDVPLILFAGRFDRDKRPLLLVEGLDQLRRRKVSFTAAFIGAGPMEGELAARIDAADLRPQVRILPPVRPLLPLLDEADLLVVTSPREPFGNVIVEAMARGVAPLAMAGSGGPDEILKDLPNLLVAGASAEALADAIESALSSPPGVPALAEVASRYTREAHAAAFARLIEALMQAA